MDIFKENSTRIIAEIGVAVAIAAVLNFLPLWKMPQGGSISLEMLPIFVIAFRWGGKSGLMAGLVYGLIQLIVNPYIIHPVQLIMDYPLPYMMLGVAGFFTIRKRQSQEIDYFKFFTVTMIAVFLRFVVHVLSGVIFFSSYAPEGQNVWLYSIIYNGSFMLPSFILCYIILIIISKKSFLETDMN
jgi:thiamine transporter